MRITKEEIKEMRKDIRDMKEKIKLNHVDIRDVKEKIKSIELKKNSK